jgi:3-hydroxybutyryl-CoA dehydrogenase
VELKDIKKILVIGAGTMGQQIAFQCAAHDYSVTLYAISNNAVEWARQRLSGYADGLVADGHLDRKLAENALCNIVTTTNPAEAAADADLLSESVPEDPVIKREVFTQFNKLCPSRTIFTTNASMLIPSLLAHATGRPDRFVAFHFHQPAWVGNVVDIMPHPGTSAEVVALVRDFARSINQIPMVLKKESYGYVFNSMYSGLNSAAISLAANGVAEIEEIDRSWMGIMKMPIGPLGMLDMVGLDTVWSVTKYWGDTLNDTQTLKNAYYLKNEYVDNGWLGVKSGRGFYTYPNPSYQGPKFVEGT